MFGVNLHRHAYLIYNSFVWLCDVCLCLLLLLLLFFGHFYTCMQIKCNQRYCFHSIHITTPFIGCFFAWWIIWRICVYAKRLTSDVISMTCAACNRCNAIYLCKYSGDVQFVTCSDFYFPLFPLSLCLFMSIDVRRYCYSYRRSLSFLCFMFASLQCRCCWSSCFFFESCVWQFNDLFAWKTNQLCNYSVLDLVFVRLMHILLWCLFSKNLLLCLKLDCCCTFYLCIIFIKNQIINCILNTNRIECKHLLRHL